MSSLLENIPDVLPVGIQNANGIQKKVFGHACMKLDNFSKLLCCITKV
jgi:hypothetical protein